MQFILAILLLLIFFLPSIGSLKCYVCNSIENFSCRDDNNLEKFIQTCPDTVQPYCRKIDQTVNGQSSVVRVCGSKSGNKECYKTAGINNANICSCNKDLCNNAMNFHRQTRILTLISSFAMIAITMFILR